MIRSRSRSLLVPLLFLTPAFACTASDDGHAAHGTPAPASTAPAAAHEADAPSPAAATPARSGELRFTAQPDWITETPTSSMRKAQYRLPGADRSADASLVVFYFGPGGGGGIEANLERWAGQFEQPDESDPRAALKSSKRTLNGLAVTEAETSGTYVAETSPGSGERLNEPGWRMLAAIFEAPEGAYYVKLVGPAATVERWQASYRSFLESIGR